MVVGQQVDAGKWAWVFCKSRYSAPAPPLCLVFCKVEVLDPGHLLLSVSHTVPGYLIKLSILFFSRIFEI